MNLKFYLSNQLVKRHMRKSPVATFLFWLLLAVTIYLRTRLYYFGLLADDFQKWDREGGHPNPHALPLVLHFLFLLFFLVCLGVAWWRTSFSKATTIITAGVLMLVLFFPFESPLRFFNDKVGIVRYEEHPYVQSPLDKPVGLEIAFDASNGMGGFLGGVRKAKLYVYMTEPEGRVFKMSCIPWAKNGAFNHFTGNRPPPQTDWAYYYQVSKINDEAADTIIDDDSEWFQTHVHALCLPVAVHVTNRNSNRICVNNEESGAVTQRILYSHPEELDEYGSFATYLKGDDAARKQSDIYAGFLKQNKRKSGEAHVFLYVSFSPYGFGAGPDLTSQLLTAMGPNSKLGDYAFWHDAIQQIQPNSLKEKGYSYCLDNPYNCKEPEGCDGGFDERRCFCH